MKKIIFLLCCSVFLHSISSAPAPAPAPHGITTTTITPSYTVGVGLTPVVTARSHQVVAHNYHGLYVPTATTTVGYVPASYVPAVAAYPGYTATTGYRYGYGYYPAYGYSYGYGSAVPTTTALW
ncbi:uncharacterized protein LOC101449206 [Ceratitis capitata]|uniref:Uncharacterized protein n=1 Tax=Ceratitis capitata TaxID=7213 RepID=W8C3B1_CERCA|nr:uncharacterized protein LOC101449206 [Ceratitis capitata]